MGRVAFTHVTKRFDGVMAVDDLTLEAADEEFLVLLGPSGCGKSTALRLIAGLEDPSDGLLQIGDHMVNRVEPKDRDVAMVFQSYALYPHMSVRKNIEFPLRARDVGRAERRRLVAEAADALALTEFLDRKPAQLSGGQRQRVALARAIVRTPQAFLMDEPLSNLDAKLRVQMRAELVELQRRLAATILYVTHDQSEAMTMGHRIAVMNNGRLQQVDDPQTVYDRPANVFVAGFIGTPPMNLFTARVDGDSLAIGESALAVALGALAAVVEPSVTAGVRPEHFTLAGHGLPATVSMVESLGHERHVHCQLETGEAVVVRHPAGTPGLHDGMGVHLDVAPEFIHIFDTTSGLRVDGARAG